MHAVERSLPLSRNAVHSLCGDMGRLERARAMVGCRGIRRGHSSEMVVLGGALARHDSQNARRSGRTDGLRTCRGLLLQLRAEAQVAADDHCCAGKQLSWSACIDCKA